MKMIVRVIHLEAVLFVIALHQYNLSLPTAFRDTLQGTVAHSLEYEDHLSGRNERHHVALTLIGALSGGRDRLACLHDFRALDQGGYTGHELPRL